jgi:hypothetical protein
MTQLANAELLGRLIPGVDLCDMDGKKIGTIARVYRDEHASVASAAAPAGVPVSRPVREGFLEIKTGPLGLGAHLYVPITAICDTTEAHAFLEITKDDLPASWREKPDDLDELT